MRPEIFCAGQTRVIDLLQHAMLRAADPIHGVMQKASPHGTCRRRSCPRLPPHAPVPIGRTVPTYPWRSPRCRPVVWRQRGPEPIQTLLLPVLTRVEHAALRQIRDHGEIPLPLRNGLLIDTEMRHDLLGASLQPEGDRPCLISQTSSQVRGNNPAAPVTEHSRSRSMARRSNQAVNWLPGSAQGTVICLTPCTGQLTRGTSV